MVAHTFPPGKYFVGDPCYVLSEAMYDAVLDTDSIRGEPNPALAAALEAKAAASAAAAAAEDPAAPAPPSVRRVAGRGSDNGMYEADAPDGGGGSSGAALPPLRFVTWSGSDCGYALPGGRSLASDSGLLGVVPWAL
jgi:hypothetical protein